MAIATLVKLRTFVSASLPISVILTLAGNAQMPRCFLQKAWLKFGREAFTIRILEEVPSNLSETHYQVRPDNLNLAEHYHINEKSEYNKDKRIVRDEFVHLIQSKAWREPIDDETRAKLLKVLRWPYLVGKRKTWNLRLSFSHSAMRMQRQKPQDEAG